jgi:Protein of unknown function (DUF2786)
MELNDVLRKVRLLITKAEHSNTDPDEAAKYRSMADKLMLKFAIDEAALDASRPAEERGKPETIDIDIAGYSDILHEVAFLATLVARHCRCRVRNYTEFRTADKVWIGKVYGFESDLRYFELLYTTLRLHMVGALMPTWSAGASLEDNCYRLHNAGFNWLEIAAMRGWRKLRWERYEYPNAGSSPWQHMKTKEVHPYPGAMFKKAYHQACKAHGTSPVIVPSAGSSTWRRSAADGYTARIDQRLGKARGERVAAEAGALVLRKDDLDAFFRDQNPDLYPEPQPEPVDQPKQRKRRERAYVAPPFNSDAYSQGSAYADTADIGGNTMGTHRDKLGSNRQELDRA